MSTYDLTSSIPSASTIKAGDNADDGISIFEVLEAENAPLLYSKNNTNQLVSSRNNYVYVNSTLKYKKIKELYVKTASNGWVKAT